MKSFLSPSRLLGLAAGTAALAVVAGTVAPAVASATAGTPPYIYGVLDPVQAGSPISFGYYTHGNPTCSITQGALPGGVTLDPRACSLSGRPLIGGLYTFTITAANGVLPNATVQTTLEVDQAPVVLTSQVDPVLGRPFDQQLAVLGYPAPTVTLDDPADLPAGLTLDPDGHLHGTPTGLQHASPLSLEASNSFGTVQSDLAVAVQSPAAQVTGTPGTATAGSFFSFQFGWTGAGTPSYSVTTGQLPSGLALLSNGTLQGTPQSPTTGQQFTVTATDGTDTAGEDVTLVVDPVPPAISGTPTTATQWLSYGWGYTLRAIPTATTTVTSGSLPPGLTLASDGYISGIPSTPGHYEFTVTATNGTGTDATIDSSIDVSSAAIVLHGVPPQGTVGSPYSFAFDVEGAPAPTVTVTGAVPPGLTVSPTGLLSGTPTKAGTYSFTLHAANGVAPSPSWLTTVTIGTATPTVSIAGSSVTEGNSGTHPMTFTISLSQASSTPVTVHWATANGTAKASSDYVAHSGAVTFAPGQTTRTVTVLVKGDRVREPTETFTVRLSRPSHATLGQATAIGTIVNDD